MKQAHFFKAKCRIGLTHPPARQKEYNYGVEDGADAILTPEFLQQLPLSKTDTFFFSDPEKISNGEYVTELVKEMVWFKEYINDRLEKAEMQVVVGGDNTVTFASVLALLERVKDTSKIGYIQFDSHGESNSYEGSESKNFHGMYMRPFFDTFDIEQIDHLVRQKMKPEQGIFIGNMVLDGDEPQFFKHKKLKTLTFKEYRKNKIIFQEYLKEFLSTYEYIHINFDIDVFHRSVAGATGIPEDGKWMKAEIFELLLIIAQHQKISFDLSELNPTRPGAERSIKIAQEILKLITNN
jgi:arginase family enzyme